MELLHEFKWPGNAAKIRLNLGCSTFLKPLEWLKHTYVGKNKCNIRNKIHFNCGYNQSSPYRYFPTKPTLLIIATSSLQ